MTAAKEDGALLMHTPDVAPPRHCRDTVYLLLAIMAFLLAFCVLCALFAMRAHCRL